MALASFPDGSYLELIAIQPHADANAVAAHAWAKQLQGDAGPTAWAVRPKNLAAEIKRLRAADVAVGDAARGGRQRPDGTRLEWETAAVGNEPNGTFFPFLISDLTPRKQRVFPKGHPTTKDFEGVSKVVIAVRDLKKSVERYRKAYDLGPPIEQAEKTWNAQLALLGGTPVILASPVNAQSWLASRLNRFGEGPCAFILSARKAGRYKAASKTRWFGADFSWFDPARLGWHLGFEELE
ncbi:MAG: VOC family protein, partial [Terriglobia bacterium]